VSPEQVKKLGHGVYRVYWASGGSSLAAVGSGVNGQRWLAPTNWCWPEFDPYGWGRVSKIELLYSEGETEPEPDEEPEKSCQTCRWGYCCCVSEGCLGPTDGPPQYRCYERGDPAVELAARRAARGTEGFEGDES
jgi:hypothetical protein